MKRKKIFLSISVVDIIATVVVVVLIAAGVHFWISDRLGVLRSVYPFQASVAQLTRNCSVDAPAWMDSIVKHVIRNNASMSNQMAYLDASGEMHTCVSGWEESMFLSPRVDTNSRFRYASQTKLFTADAVLSLVNSNRLSLDQKLVDVFPELLSSKDSRVSEITIRFLLIHRAGFDRLETPDPLFEHFDKPWCYHDIESLSDQELDFSPGERFSYSNVGYCVLGEVIGRVAEKPYQEYMKGRYQLPSRGMKYVDGPYLQDEVRYDFRNSDFYGEDYYRFFDFKALSSSAGLSGSAKELAKAVGEMVAKEPLNLLSAQVPDDCDRRERRECFGFAFYEYHLDGGMLYIQEGFLPGTMSLTVVDESGRVLVLLMAGTPLNGFKKTEELVSVIHNALYN